MRVVHADLVARGFMKKLDDMDGDTCAMIQNAPFQHYHPWRIVYKDSQSTPVRMVVDPTMTGLNYFSKGGEQVR